MGGGGGSSSSSGGGGSSSVGGGGGGGGSSSSGKPKECAKCNGCYVPGWTKSCMTTTEAYCKNPTGKNANWKHSGSSGTAIWCKGHGGGGNKVTGSTVAPSSGGNVLVGKSTHYMSY